MSAKAYVDLNEWVSFDLYGCNVCGEPGAVMVTGKLERPNGKGDVGTLVCDSEACAATAVEWTLDEPCLQSSIQFVRLDDIAVKIDLNEQATA